MAGGEAGLAQTRAVVGRGPVHYIMRCRSRRCSRAYFTMYSRLEKRLALSSSASYSVLESGSLSDAESLRQRMIWLGWVGQQIANQRRLQRLTSNEELSRRGICVE